MAGDFYPYNWPGVPYQPNYAPSFTYTWPDPRVDALEKRVAALEAEREGPPEPTTCTRNDDGSYTFSRDGEEFTIPASEVHFLKDIFR